MRQKIIVAAMPVVALILAGCARQAPVLPDDPVDQAASCAVIAAATERGQAGAKGALSADAQARIFHYALLAGSAGRAFDDDRAQAVFQREPALFDSTIKGKWQALRPACDAAYPATRIAAPTLPAAPLDRMLQCYMLVDFLRKAYGGLGGSFAEASAADGALSTRLDAKLAPALAKAGVGKGSALQARRAEALAAAARLGQPPAVVAACRAAYGDGQGG